MLTIGCPIVSINIKGKGVDFIKMAKPIDVLSLFSGIGAFEKALTNVGINYKLVGFSEIDKWAIQSYCAIHKVDKSLNVGDIKGLKAECLPNADLITYGFPCTDISLAGKQKGIRRNSPSGLLYEAERIIESKQPKYAIAENVKNLVGKKHREDFNQLLLRLESYGYNNYWKVLNAKDFGIPQNRERVFVVSIRKDIDNRTFSFPDSTKTMPHIKEFLETEVSDSFIVENRRDLLIKSLYNKNKLRHLQVFEDRRDEGARVFKDDAVGTLRAIDSCGDKRVLRLHNNKWTVYKITPREAFRLMGFSDSDYTLVEQLGISNTQLYKQAGNSIVIPVLEEIFKQLFNTHKAL